VATALREAVEARHEEVCVMLQVGCKDIGVLGCDFVAQGEKVRKVEDRMLEHMRDAHPQLVAGLTFGQHKELETRITSRMHVPEADGEPHEAERHGILRVACTDLGAAECDFVAVDRKVRKLRERVFDHMRDEHPEMIVGLTFEERKELERRVEAAAHRD
jgi:predicted small metal-binding protein